MWVRGFATKTLKINAVLGTIPPILHLPPHAGSKNILRINKCCDEIKKLKTLFTNKNLDAHSLTILSPSRQHSLILVT